MFRRFCAHVGCTQIVDTLPKDFPSQYCPAHRPNVCLFTLPNKQCNKFTFLSSGLCNKHHEYAAKLVAQGKTTWSRLYRNGKIKQLVIS